MKKLCIIFSFLLLLAGCASFGIRNAGNPDGREGRDYTMTVRAWDKDAKSIDVMFMYRVNGGTWAEKKGIYNGSLYEAVVAGSELPAGQLDYYASMVNSKGKKITTPPATAQILSFAQAKAKAEREYLSLLADGGTGPEFVFNETAVFRLNSGGSAVPASVECNVGTGTGATVLSAPNLAGRKYEVSLAPPHSAAAYSFQWTVKWQDAEFGELVSVWPATPKSVKILDQAELKARIEKDFRAAMNHAGPVSGTFFTPPMVQTKLVYTALLAKYSTKQRQVNLLLKRADFTKTLKMTETANGVFSAEVPVKDLEQGPLTYSFQYTDTFNGAGALLASYPSGENLKIQYRNLAELKQEAAAKLVLKFTHQPPLDAVEGAPLSLRVDVADGKLQVASVTLDGTGQFPIGTNIPFIASQGAWFAALPAAVIRPGASTYRISVVVRDPQFGDIKLTLPAANVYTVTVKSLAAVRAEREAVLAKSLSHTLPATVVSGRELVLAMTQNPLPANGVAGSSASLFFRTASAPKYREIRALQPTDGIWKFTLPAAETTSNYIQYYFSVSVKDPVLGSLGAILRSTAGDAISDFIVTPTAAAAVPAAAPAPAPTAAPVVTPKPAPAPVPTPVTAPVQTPVPAPVPAPAQTPFPVPAPVVAPAPTPSAPVTATPIATPVPVTETREDGFDPQTYYRGTAADRSGIRFFVTMKRELGLYDVSVMLKVQNSDREYREFKMDRKGKEYSYTFDTKALPIGNRIDFYYRVYKKNAAERQISDANGVPFHAVIQETAAGNVPDGDKGKKK